MHCKLLSATARCLLHTTLLPLPPSVRDCGSPPALLNGQMSFASTTYLSTANYSCNVGYNLRGPNELTCQSSLQWRYGDSHYGVYHQHPPQSCQSMCYTPTVISTPLYIIHNMFLLLQLLTVAPRAMYPMGTWNSPTALSTCPMSPSRVTLAMSYWVTDNALASQMAPGQGPHHSA